MTPRMTVLARHPDAVARRVQPQAHAIEAYERRLHWAICAGPGEDALVLGVSLTEEAAWAAAAASVIALRTADSRDSGVPRPWGIALRSASRAARAPAREATSESVELDTPSRTRSTHRSPGDSLATRAMAS